MMTQMMRGRMILTRAAASLRISATPRSTPGFASRQAVSFPAQAALFRAFHSSKSLKIEDEEPVKKPVNSYIRFLQDEKAKGDNKMVRSPPRESCEDAVLSVSPFYKSSPVQSTVLGVALVPLPLRRNPCEACGWPKRAFGHSQHPRH
jgi:hypothetical protein